jgi:hypothetical protein
MPTCPGGKAGEEVRLVGVVKVLTDYLVDHVGVRTDQDAQPVRLNAVQDDRRRLHRTGRRVGDKVACPFDKHRLNARIRLRRCIPADRGKAGTDLRDLRGVQLVGVVGGAP